MKKGLVSVVIPNYNYAHFLSEAVDSVLAQTYPDIEIIVVDDGSTDESQDIINGYGDKITAVLQQNGGVAAARNNGVSETNGEYFAFLDADDIWLPEKVEKQIALFLSDEHLGMVHVGVIEIDSTGRAIRERLDGGSEDVSRDMLLFTGNGMLGGGSGLMVSRKAFDAVGGFDERLSTSADWDFCYQISSRFRVGFVPELLLKYRVHDSNMHANIAVMEHDMLLAYEKAFDGKTTAFSSECYGSLYKTLSASYFHAGNYAAFVRTSLESLLSDPGNLWYFLKFPFRKFSKR